MKTLSVWDRLSLGLAAATALTTALLYPRLSDPMAVHFDAHGIANGWMPRWLGATFVFLIGVPVVALLRGGGRWFPESWRARMNASPMRVVSFIVVLLLASIHAVTLYASIAHPPNVARLIALVLAMFWLLFGLVMPRIRRNPYAGIRTPWTMTSDEVWSRTHRFGGHLMVMASIVCFLGALIGSLSLALGAVVVSALVPAVYSYFVARRVNLS